MSRHSLAGEVNEEFGVFQRATTDRGSPVVGQPFAVNESLTLPPLP